jgi:hypothetical protein
MSSPGILRQYLEDYSARASAAKKDVDAYNKTLRLDANGNPILYQDRSYTSQTGGSDEGYTSEQVTSYKGLTKRADGKWYPDGPSVSDPGQVSLLPDETDIYMARQGGTPKFRTETYTDEATGKTMTRQVPDGYDYPNKPEDFKEKGPSFTRSQLKKIGQPSTGTAIAGAMRGSDGVISQFLGRGEKED